MNEHQAANLARRKRTNRNILIVIGVLIASFLLCAGLGALVGPTEATDEPDARTTQFAAPPTTEPTVEPTTEPTVEPTTEPTPTTPEPEPAAVEPPPVREAASGTYGDPRCAAASDTLVALVSAGLNKDGYTLTNGTVVDGGGVTYFGATTLKPDGRMDNRSDVWVVKGGLVYASTGGARNGSIFPKASTALDISPGDELVQLTDRCVIDLTMP